MSSRPLLATASALLLVSASSLIRAQSPSAEDPLVKKARTIHERVIALDTHNDIEPDNFTTARNYTQRLDTQVNLPKMIEGGLDASFFIVYVGQPSLKDNDACPRPGRPHTFGEPGVSQAVRDGFDQPGNAAPQGRR